ncbi:MAG: protoporphyrinogen oxidase [Actinomycetota bacterium]
MSNHRVQSHVIIIGGGITGLAAAAHIAHGHPGVRVTLVEGSGRLGGVISASPFAGLSSLDESADAFLLRSPAATGLAALVGLGDELVHPATGEAYIWHDELHDIPSGTVLGVPGSLRSIWSTSLYSPRGSVRASLEPLLPRRVGRSSASLGGTIRARYGSEVLERAVDPLVGGIYAIDTDAFSVHAMPQLDDLISSRSSLMAAARKTLRTRSDIGPVFATPRRGMTALVEATAEFIRRSGVDVRTAWAVSDVSRDASGYVVVGPVGEIRGDADVVA